MSTDPVQLTSPPPDPLPQVSRIAQFIFGVYMVVLNVLIIYLLCKIWPDSIPPQDSIETISVFFGKIRFDMSLEVRFLAIAVLAGALGSPDCSLGIYSRRVKRYEGEVMSRTQKENDRLNKLEQAASTRQEGYQQVRQREYDDALKLFRTALQT
jgi:hypothetical protein